MFVITGGGSGIGKALALALVARDKKVLIVGRRESLLQKVASLSPKIHYICADISTASGRDLVCKEVQKAGGADALINNAGILDPLVPLEDVDLEAWRQAMATNVEAPLFLTQQLMPCMSEGRVLNMGSGAAYIPLVGMGTYCVSKAALHMLTRCQQVESSTSLAFTCVTPGITDTDMQTILRTSESLDSEHHDLYNQLKKNEKLVSPETVAAFLCWLLLDISKEQYVSQEWDIYDTTHHVQWLTLEHTVPPLDL